MKHTALTAALAMAAVAMAGPASGQLLKPLRPVMPQPSAQQHTATLPMPAHVPTPQTLEQAQTAAAVKKLLATPGDVILTPVALLDPAHMSVEDDAGKIAGYLNLDGAADVAVVPNNTPGAAPAASFQLEANSPYAPKVFSAYTVLPNIVMSMQIKANTAYAFDCTVEAHGAHYDLGSTILKSLQHGDIAFSDDPAASVQGHIVVATPRTNNYYNEPSGNLSLTIYLKSGKPQRDDMWSLMKEPTKSFYGCRVYTYTQVMQVNAPKPAPHDMPAIQPKLPTLH